MHIGVVVPQPPTEVPMEGDGVEEGLQRVVGGDHFGLQRVGPVVPGGQRLAGRAQLVGLVVGQKEAIAGQAEDEVEAPRQVAPEGPAEDGVAEVRGVAGDRIVLGEVLVQEVGDGPEVQARRGRVRRRPAGSRRSARRAGPPGRCRAAQCRRPSGRGGSRWRHTGPRRPPRCRPGSRCARPPRRPAPSSPSAARSGSSNSVCSNTPWMTVPTSAPPGMSASCRGTAPSPRRRVRVAPRQRRHGHVFVGGQLLLRFAPHRGLVVQPAGDARVRRPAPADVERPVEDRRLQVRRDLVALLPSAGRRQADPLDRDARSQLGQRRLDRGVGTGSWRRRGPPHPGRHDRTAAGPEASAGCPSAPAHHRTA